MTVAYSRPPPVTACRSTGSADQAWTHAAARNLLALERVFLRLLLRRLQLPPVRLAPGEDGRADYLAALGAAEIPLQAI